MSENKKCISTLDMDKVSAILLDIAGTTTAISFVKETVNPYVVKNVEEFLKNSWDSADVQKALEKFEEKYSDATKAAEAVKNLTEKEDSSEGLKAIQGLILKKGYEDGELKGHIFDDVPKFFESWSATKKFAIFSSGSVESQQLLFKNSSEGDLTSHIKNFFDLSVGSKADAETYKKIAKELEVAPVDILFLTDDVKEAEAAKSADFNAVLVEREGNSTITDESKANFAVVKSFAEISVEKIKRKIVDDEASVEQPPSKMAKIEVVEGKVEDALKTEDKKEIETAEEAMEVDQDPIEAEKVEAEVPSEEAKTETEKATEDKKAESEAKTPTVEESKAEDKSEAMEVDSTGTDQKTENAKEETEQKTNAAESEKAESDIGTQTKRAVTNECETQTTITLAAVEELPIKKVEDILKSTSQENTEDKTDKKEDETKTKEQVKEKEIVESEKPKEETKINEESEKPKEVVKENGGNGVTKEVKEEAKEAKEDMKEAKEDVKEVKEDVKEVKEDVKEVKENVKEVKEDVKEVKEDVKEAKEDVKKVEEDVKEVKEDVKKVEEDVKEVKEDVKEVKEDVKEVKEDVKEVKEDVKEVKEDVKEVKEDVKKVEEEVKESVKEVIEDVKAATKENGEVKENGDSCKKAEENVEVVSNGSSEEKKVDSNGAQENGSAANGVKDEPSVNEKENKSQLANGKESDVSNGEAGDATNGGVEQKEEIKVKKIADKVESTPVSVEA